MRIDVFDDSNRKRPAPAEPIDGLDPAKRQRLGAPVPIIAPATPPIPPLPPGPVSFRQLFTLNPDGNTANFDVQAFKDPEQLLRILVPVLQSIDEARMNNSINVCDEPLHFYYDFYIGMLFYCTPAIQKLEKIHTRRLHKIT